MPASKKSKSYNEGRRAFLNGDPSSDNKIKGGPKRGEWFDGYYDARIVSRLGIILKKYDLVWE